MRAKHLLFGLGLLVATPLSAAPAPPSAMRGDPGQHATPEAGPRPSESPERRSREREQLERILARREFRAARRAAQLELDPPELPPAPQFLESLARWAKDNIKRFTDWLDRWLQRQQPELPQGGSWIAAGSGPLTWTLVALTLALLAYVAYRWARRRTLPPSPGQPIAAAPGVTALPDALSQAPDVWARFAEQFARSGEWRLALRALYLELLATLHRRGRIRYERQRTNGDYVAALRATPLGDDFRRLSLTFDVAWYGNKPFAQADYEQALALVRAIDGLTSEQATP